MKKIYTKKGDCCRTTLLGGVPVTKDHIRLEAYGTIDELIAHMALLYDMMEWEDIKVWIMNIEDKLMICAAHIASDGSISVQLPALREQDITWLEEKIDTMEEELTPLHHFVLPGGNNIASQAHICRTVCRRAERCIVAVYQQQKFDDLILKYMNRLSDFLFVLSRYVLKRKNVKDILWKPNRG